MLAGGVVQVLIGQPLDLVKVRLQTQGAGGASAKYSGVLDCVRQTYQQEGIAAFYKGTLAPLLGIGACVATQFAAFHEARRYFVRKNQDAGAPDPNKLGYAQLYASGACAGIANTVISV